MNKTPSKYPLAFFRWFCNPEFAEDIEGDLIERYEKRVNEKKAANWLLSMDVLKLFRPGIIRNFEGTEKLNYYGMLKNNIKIALRSFKRDKAFTAINVLGLTLGVWSALLTALWIQDEWKYDRFHLEKDQLHRLLINFEWEGELLTNEGTAYPTGDALVSEIPEVLERVRYSTPDKQALVINGKVVEQEIAGGDENFFEVFSFPMIEGSPGSCLKEKGSVVISEQIAENFFKGKSAIGETISLKYADKEFPFYITGVYQRPTHSSIQFDIMLSMQDIVAFSDGYDNWGNTYFETYLIIDKQADLEAVEAKMNEMAEANDAWYSLITQKFEDQHLYADFKNGEVNGGLIDYIKMFAIAALCTILIACFNYINLTTARSLKRTKEIGVRKVIGAKKLTLAGQFLTESALIVIFSCLSALVLTILTLPYFNSLLAKNISMDFNHWRLYGAFAILMVAIVLLSGLYPASLLASFKPLGALKNVLPKSGFQTILRKVLVGVQFSISIILVSASLIIQKQLKFFIEKDLGFDKDQIVYFQLDEESYKSYDNIKNELVSHSAVQAVSSSSHDFIGAHVGFTGDVQWRLRQPDQEFFFGIHHVDHGLTEMLGMEFLKGTTFDRNISRDSTQFVINETAAKALGFENPVGERLAFWGTSGRITGMVKDFHFETLHSSIRPIILINSSSASFVFLKAGRGQLPKAVEHMIATHESFSSLPIKFNFLDKRIAEGYENEATVSKLTNISSILAISISLMGILGLIILSCERRIKEIGIRKVLGSSSWRLVMLFSREFTGVVLIAILIGAPIAYYALGSWLDNYAYRVDLTWWPFIVAGLTATLFSWIIVGTQTWRASNANPVKALRDE